MSDITTRPYLAGNVADFSSAGRTSVSFSYDSAAVPYRLLMVGIKLVSSGSTNPEAAGVTYAGRPCILYHRKSGFGGANRVTFEWWYQLAPATGSNTFAIASYSGGTIRADAVSLYTFGNVRQADPFGAFASYSGSGGAPNLAITTLGKVGLILAGLVALGGNTDPFSWSAGTEIYDAATGGSSTQDLGYTTNRRWFVTKGTYNNTCTLNASSDYAGIVLEIRGRPQVDPAAVRTRIGDVSGNVIGQVDFSINAVSWLLNDMGIARLDLGRANPKATAQLLEFGNRIYMEFGNGLPAWGGVIEPPREWTPDGRIQVYARDGAQLLQLRTTDKGRYFDGSTAGEIFKALIREADQRRPLPVSLGHVYTGGPGHSPEYHLKDLFKIIRDSVCGTLSNYEFEVAPVLADNVISFEARLYERRGRDRLGHALAEGSNVVGARLIEQGPLINYWWGAGAGAGWGDDRPVDFSEDTDSQNLYGLREDSIIMAGVKIPETLSTNLENRIAETAAPGRLLELVVSDQPPACFADYDIGDRLSVDLYSVGFEGFSGQVRILAREYSKRTGLCSLAVEILE